MGPQWLLWNYFKGISLFRDISDLQEGLPYTPEALCTVVLQITHTHQGAARGLLSLHNKKAVLWMVGFTMHAITPADRVVLWKLREGTSIALETICFWAWFRLILNKLFRQVLFHSISPILSVIVFRIVRSERRQLQIPSSLASLQAL